jgi:hypothetical protein
MPQAKSVTPSGFGLRISVTCFALFLLAGFCFGQSASSPSPSGSRPTTKVLTNWNQFHRRNMARFNPYEKFLTVNNVRSLGLKWSYSTAGVVDSSLAVVNGVIYVGSFDGNIYAFSLKHGSE